MATRGPSRAHMRHRHVGVQTEAWLARCQSEQRLGCANRVVLWMRNSKPFPTLRSCLGQPLADKPLRHQNNPLINPAVGHSVWPQVEDGTGG